MGPTVLAAWIAAGVSALTLAGTLVAQYVGYRATSRELDRTFTEQRTRGLNERFATAAEQLGSDKPAVRVAGVYAMAGLADDWEENRQTCVDVLCAYLRMPYEPDPGRDAPESQRLDFQAIREVRHTVIRLVTAHLKNDAAVSWQGLRLDFTGVVFDGGDFSGAKFSSGIVSFTNAEFSDGTVSFRFAIFSGGTVSFNGARFCGGTVDFHKAEFSGGETRLTGAEFSGSTVTFSGARFSGNIIDFNDTRFSGGTVSFASAQFPAGTVYFGRAGFSGSEVDFRDARFSGGAVLFWGTWFSGGTVDFRYAEFSRGAVSFKSYEIPGNPPDAHFSGGTVDFRDPRAWSVPPVFPWTEIPPAGVKLPMKEDQSTA
jgi:uncharacterized protein YjbI with pentapeptide repeats